MRRIKREERPMIESCRLPRFGAVAISATLTGLWVQTIARWTMAGGAGGAGGRTEHAMIEARSGRGDFASEMVRVAIRAVAARKFAVQSEERRTRLNFAVRFDGRRTIEAVTRDAPLGRCATEGSMTRKAIVGDCLMAWHGMAWRNPKLGGGERQSTDDEQGKEHDLQGASTHRQFQNIRMVTM